MAATNDAAEIPSQNTAPEIAVPEKSLDRMQITSKKRRKDKLQPIATADIQFETILLDGDEVDSTLTKKKQRKKAKKRANEDDAEQTKPRSPKPRSPMTLLDNACDSFLEDPETEKIIRDIAEERVRINYLLASYGMSDINFILGDTVNSLDNQLNERFRQRNRKRVNSNSPLTWNSL